MFHKNLLFSMLLLFASGSLCAQQFPPAGGSGGESVICASAQGIALTTTGTTKQALATCTIPANTFPGKRMIRIQVSGIHAANVNTTTVSVDLAAEAAACGATCQVIARISSVSGEEQFNTWEGLVVGAETWTGRGLQALSSGTTSGNIYGGPSRTSTSFAAPIVVTFYATTPVSAGDVTINGYRVVVLN